ncbi:MerR family DNA-binding protein [Dawidia soli]|uniref:MerR family DNA-binding protein n=1 Tax=Dawidia soli TaxID=2782352 RepID=A0AAP2GCH8_9BACT|nr:MerR family DNA-binding protein [Dawidia soli]MBT1686167.1 MerR family DNA-binding protein [Dawidia soli]
MLIGEIVKRTGLSRDTIRFYEKEGLIKMSKKQRRENNYKEYPENVVDRLILIKSIQDLGFTLKEIDTFFSLWQEEDASCENLVYTLENKLVQIDTQIQKLTQLRGRLVSSLDNCRRNNCEFEKSVPTCIKC